LEEIEMKKVLNLLCALALAFAALTGCSNSSSSSSGSGDSKMADIYAKLTADGSSYMTDKAQAEEMGTTYEESLNGDTVTIKVSGEYENSEHNYVYDGEYVTYTGDDSSYYGLYMFGYFIDAVAEVNGMDPELVSAYTFGLTNLDMTNDYYKVEEDGDKTTVKFYAKDAFEMTELDDMYINEKAAKNIEEFPAEGGNSSMMTVGKIRFYAAGSKDSGTVYVAEYGDKNTDLTYKSIINAVDVLKPDHLDEFKAEFTELKEITNDNYSVKFATEEDAAQTPLAEGGLDTSKYSTVIVTFGAVSTEE